MILARVDVIKNRITGKCFLILCPAKSIITVH